MPRRRQRPEICVHNSASHYNYKHSIFSVQSYYNHRYYSRTYAHLARMKCYGMGDLSAHIGVLYCIQTVYNEIMPKLMNCLAVLDRFIYKLQLMAGCKHHGTSTHYKLFRLGPCPAFVPSHSYVS